MIGELFNSSGEKLFLAVEVRFSTLLLPLPTNAYVSFSPWATTENMAAFAGYCHRCRSVYKRFNKDECMLRTRPVNRWPKKHEKVAALESWRFDSILCRWLPSVFDLEWPFTGHFSSRIPPIKYTKVLGNHLLYSCYHSLPLGSSLETSQELAEQPTWLEEQWSFCSSLKLISLFNSADRLYFCGDG